jgi:hypothetical protein
VTETYTLASSAVTRNGANGDPDHGTIAPGETLSSGHVDPTDAVRLIVAAGAHVATITFRDTQDASHDCEAFGDIYAS